jgi:hypothetical protein
MNSSSHWIRRPALTLAAFVVFVPWIVIGQGGAQGGGRGGGGQGAGAGRGQGGGGRGAQAPLPEKPTAVVLPTVSAEVTGPGEPFNSTSSLPAGRDLAYYKYEAKEYFLTGTANGKPYKTRIVVRKPKQSSKFSGLVVAEAMHPSGASHMFEFTSDYTMSSGHMAVEIFTSGLNELTAANQERYKDLSVSGDQTNEVIAQVGSLVKSKKTGTPFANVQVRKMVLLGTSATAGILNNYLPAHMVYRTPDMQRIFDGFLPMSFGQTPQKIDVPLIQVPTMTEVIGNATTREDGDDPGNQYRVYEFAGMAHVDSRDSVRFKPDPCGKPKSNFPEQSYMSVALNHLLQWVDKNKVPPRAARIEVDHDTANDGSPMALDAKGNAKGGIRNPYVDVPVAKFSVRNEAAATPVPNPSPWIVAHGAGAPAQMCGLAGYEIPMSKDDLRKAYTDKKHYQDLVKKKLDELEKAGWSLPVYRDLILGDAAKVEF